MDTTSKQRIYRSKVYLDAVARANAVGGICSLCGQVVLSQAETRAEGLPDGAIPSIDHTTPLALGGSNTPDNFRVVHRTCNYSVGGTLGNRISPGRSKSKRERGRGFGEIVDHTPALKPRVNRRGERGAGFWP